jgi:YYY domain-containing protein
MSQRRLRIGFGLVLVIALAFFLRMVGLNWDDYSYLHPDERFLSTITSKIGKEEFLSDAVREECTHRESGQFFDTACSPYNPNNVNDGSFAYGTLPLFVVRAVALLAEQINLGQLENPQLWHSFDYIHLVGRATNAVFEILTIILVFTIGSRLFSSTQALLATAFYAFAVLAIQLSHFWIVDTQANFFCLLGVWASIELSKSEKFRWYLVFGLALGASLASRINLVPMVMLLPLALLIRWQQVYANEADKRDLRRWLLSAASLALASFTIAFIAFRIFQPYAFSGPRFTDIQLNPKWLEDVRHVSELSAAPSEGWPPSIQWFNRSRYIYPLINLVFWGLNPLVGLVALGTAVVALLIQVFNRRLSQDTGILVLWIVGYFVVMGGVHQMTMRYYLPLYAPLCLMAAWGLFKLPLWWRKRAIAASLLLSLIWAVAFVSIYFNTHTRLEASQWIVDEIPAVISLSNDSDEILSMAIDGAEFSHHLLTAQNHESYLGEPFDVGENQVLQGFRLEFVEPIVVDFRLQLMQEVDGEDAGVSLYQLNLQTDANGMFQYNGREDANFAGIQAGRYRWHIQFDWPDSAPLHHFMFISQWAGSASERQTSHSFLLPTSSSDEVFLSEPSLNELYLSEVFELSGNQAFQGFTLEFVEPIVVDFSLQLMSEDGASLVYQFDMQTDSNGLRQYAVRDIVNFSIIAAGRYQWRIQFNDSDASALPSFRFSSQWAGGASPELSHQFLGSETVVNEVSPNESGLNESYLSESFELSGNDSLQGFTVQFVEPIVVDFSLLLVREANGEVIYQFDMQSDSNGLRQFDVQDAESFEIGETGTYQWRIQFNGDGAVAHSFRFVSRWLSDSNEQEPYRFLSPYPSVDYVLIDELGLSAVLNPVEDGLFSKIIIPHIRNELSSLSIEIGEQVIRADSIATLNENSFLGTGHIFLLEEAIELTANEPLSLTIRANEAALVLGSVLATEGAWDDSLPSRHCRFEQTGDFFADFLKLRSNCIPVDVYARRFYQALPLNMAEPDTMNKWLRISDILMKADYLLISSNRFYDALTRVPERFPASLNYYDNLFRENLGYSTTRIFQRSPSIFGIPLPEQVLPSAGLPSWLNEIEAEEAFTVYDHPTVYIFENTTFGDEQVQLLLSALPEENSDESVDAEVPARVSLNLETLPAPSFSQSGQDLSQDGMILEASQWIIGFVLIGWISMPLMFLLFPMLPLRGLWFGRSIAWLMLSLVSWWLTSVLSVSVFWTQAGLWSLLILYIVLNLRLGWQSRDVLFDFVKQHWKSILAAEAFFFLALTLGLIFRAVNPDLWHGSLGGEKPMDFAYFNAVLRSSIFPPPNPWLSGYQINYYYFGFVIAAAPSKLGNFTPSVATNLVLASIYALVMLNTGAFLYAVLHQMRRAARIALTLLGTAFVMLSGNLATLVMLLQNEADLAPHRWYWYPTRVLAEAGSPGQAVINEFPAFSFLFGDLHAHIINLLPISCFAVVLLLIIRQKNWWLGIFLGQFAAIIYMTNTWDVLLYAPLGFVGILLASRSWAERVRLGLVVGISGIVTVFPYLMSNALGTNGGIMLWTGERSFVEPFFVVWGIPIMITVLYINYRLKQVFFQQTSQAIESGLIALGVLGLMALPTEFSTSGLAALLVLAAAILFYYDAREYRKLSIGIMLIFGILFLLEYFVIRGDVGRMNTVFKISFQLWLWIAVLIVLILQVFLENRKRLLLFLTLGLLGLGLLFPLKAVPARFEDNQRQTLSLDGNAFLSELHVNYQDTDIALIHDRDLIRFMLQELDGFPVIAEWYSTEYAWNSRISVQTGFLSVVGWQNHLKQQYTFLHPEIEQRVDDIQTLYSTNQQAEIERIISRYGIDYIVVGGLERVYANSLTIALFESMAQVGELTVIYNQDASQLYRVEVTEP